MGVPRTPKSKGSARLFAVVALAAFAVQLLPDAFAAPRPMAARSSSVATAVDAEVVSSAYFVNGARTGHFGREAHTSLEAVDAGLSIGQKVLNAMGAGAVASVIQAALSAVGEPIVNRVLVKRMKLMDAIKDVSPAMMIDFFKTTLATNFLKFPFFEAINAFCAALPIPPTVRGFFTGFIFTTATLPVTNYRYRKSMQMEVNWSNIYEAYLPTVIRDIAYGIVRNYSTLWLAAVKPEWPTYSPQVLFIVVIVGCLGSAPFNEWRGFLLQSKGQELSFNDFFKPSNFVRSTGLGAFKQGLALAVGYWCAPPVTKFVHTMLAAMRG